MSARSWLPILVSFVAAVAALLPSTLTTPFHADEAQYAWSGAYYSGRVAHAALSPESHDEMRDPGMSPRSYWALTQPMGTRFIYGAALGLTGAPAPARPYDYMNPELQSADSIPSAYTLRVMRVTAVLCAASAAALFALRLGWPAVFATAALLTIPFAQPDLSRAWAEAPLFLGIALAAALFRTRWFAMACGVAATFKLTALGLWPIAYMWGPLGRSRASHFAALAVAAVTWSLLTPPSWYAGGPLFLVPMWMDRAVEYTGQSATRAGVGGFFLPSRYFLPIEIVLLYGAAWAVPRLWARLRRRDRGYLPANDASAPAEVRGRQATAA